MAQKREKDPEEPKMVTLADARAFCEWLSVQQKAELTLPTLNQLRVAIDKGFAMPMGPEWTREGFVFDPATGKLNQNPGEDILAAFRPALETGE